MKVSLCYIGKPRGREADALTGEYAVRISRYCRFEVRPLRDEKAASAVDRAYRVVLDPEGRQMSSEQFARFFETVQRDVTFFVGGADGFSQPFRERADRLLSLSKMTLPHELARVILAEQIYRAFTILQGHPYPR